MKLFALAALTAALALPMAAGAQQAPAPGVSQQAPAGTQATSKVYRRWSRLLNGVNLSSQQHDQIQSLLDQYAQAHPAGSQRVPGAAHQLHDQIFGILTPNQQAQVRQTMQTLRTQHEQRRQQLQQQQGPAPAATPYVRRLVENSTAPATAPRRSSPIAFTT
jgi:Spy/CpxP family protein refolding chaperone